MIKKDYELIAATLRRSRIILPGQPNREKDTAAQWRAIAIAMAQKLGAENPMFNAKRFYAACGMDQED